MTRTLRPAVSLLATTALALTLGACKIDNRPLLARGGPPPAEPVAAPPPIQPAAYPQPTQAYAYPQRAYALSRTVYQRPPSYAFDYGEEQPWAWDDGDQGTMFAEPIDDGYRYYYYEPGAAYPYFVQDSDYGYAYGANGGLVALFAATGALIAADHYRDYAPRAERYWTRGYDLDRTYRRSPRYPVQTAAWRERAPAVASGHDRWFRAASAQPAWREAAAAHPAWSRGGGRPGREFAAAPTPLPAFGPEARGGPGQRREAHGEPARNGATFARGAEPRPGAFAHGPAQVRGPALAQAQPHGPTPGREAHGPNAHGGQAFARAAETHGREVSARGPAPFHASPQARAQSHGPPGGHGPGHGGQAFARAAEPRPGGGGGHGPAQFHAPPQQHAQGPQHGPPGGGQAFARAAPHGGGGGGGHGPAQFHAPPQQHAQAPQPHGPPGGGQHGGGQHGGGGPHGGGGGKPGEDHKH